MSVYATDGTPADVRAAVNDASTGEEVVLPPGSFPNWGTGGAIQVNKAITIRGAGQLGTVLTGITGSPTIFSVSSGAMIRDFRFNGGGAGTVVFNVTGPEGTNIGARFTGLTLDFTGNLGYRMFYIDRVYALADNCTFIGGDTQNEFIYMRGPNNAWDSAANPGTDQAFYFEDCTFEGAGYPDANACARMVFRYCTVNGKIKFDGHGIASNAQPVRGVRLLEVYGNTWTAASGTSAWRAIEPRGGGFFIFGNRAVSNGTWPTITLQTYEVTGRYGNLGGVWQTPYNYPIPDQIGTGPGTVVLNAVGGSGTQQAAAEPGYMWDNAKNSTGSPTDWAPSFPDGNTLTYTTNGAAHSIGATTINVTAAGSSITAGNWLAIAGDNNRYRIASNHAQNATTFTIDSPGLVQAIPASPVTLTANANTNWQGQLSDHTAIFTTATHITVANRDYFRAAYGWPAFDGSSGIGHGTKAQMLAITGTTVGVGFWVTDEGEWNSNSPGVDGQLYAWNGSSWVLKYKPYPYPHPLRAEGPDVTAPLASASIAASGATLIISLSEACTAGSGGTGGITLSAAGGPVTATYASGNGTSQWLYALDRTIIGSETITWSYSTANGIEDAAGNDLAAVSAAAVTNNSTETVINAEPNPWRAAVIPGVF